MTIHLNVRFERFPCFRICLRIVKRFKHTWRLLRTEHGRTFSWGAHTDRPTGSVFRSSCVRTRLWLTLDAQPLPSLGT